MSPKICPCMALTTGVKFVAFGDTVCSIFLSIASFFGLVGLLFPSEEEIRLDSGQRISGFFGAILLGILAAAQLCTASVLYKYTKVSNQNNRGFWQWLLVATIIIIWFLVGFIEEIREWEVIEALFCLVIVFYKMYGVLVVAAFKKDLTGHETSATYSATNA